MTDDELREMIALAAVDALDPDEQRDLNDALADRPDLAAELDDLRAVTVTMATAVAETPPPSIRAAVLAAIADEPKVPSAPNAPASSVVPFPDRRRHRFLLAAAAVLIVVGGAFIATRVFDDSTTDDIAAVIDDPNAVRVGLRGEIGELTIVYSEAKRRAVMLGSNIAGLADDKVYELWTSVPDSEAMRALGTFSPHDGTVSVVMDDMTLPPTALFAVTVEPLGGSEAPTTPVVAASS